MKVVFVELPHKAGEVGVLEHAGQDKLRELIPHRFCRNGRVGVYGIYNMRSKAWYDLD